MARERRDADRRSRQCAKFARLIRIARLVTGNGRWGPQDLAREIECSQRTIFRDIEILSAAGIPVFYDKSIQAYRVADRFRFSGLDPAPAAHAGPALADLLNTGRRLLRDGTALLATLQYFCDQVERLRHQGS